MAQTWQELATDARKAANVLVTQDRFRSAVSRAYYAAYSKVTHELVMTAGLMMPPGREGPSHARLRPLIETSMPGLPQPRRVALSRLVGRLHTLRIDANYKPSVQVEAREAREAVSIMKTIFEAF